MKVAPDSFLKTLGAYLEAQGADQSANQPALLGTIDSAYAGIGLPRVKFDGESVTSDKVFAITGSYNPVANDRVVLIPVGTTYMILNKIVTSYTAPPTAVPAVQTTGAVQFTSTITITNSNQDLAGTTFVTTSKANVQGLIIASYDVEITGTAGDIFEGQILVDGAALTGSAAGKVHSSLLGRVNVSSAWPFTLASIGSHNFRLQALKVNNGSTVITYQNHTRLTVLLGDM
jgi:hypothetical protein